MQAAIKVLTDAIELAERRKRSAQDEIDEHEHHISLRRESIAYYDAEIAALKDGVAALNPQEARP